MSGTTESLRRKIQGARDLGAVVRSMKALAASSIGQYERAVRSLDDYYRTVELGLGACLRQPGPLPFGLGPGRPGGRPVGAVVFGSDQGLVGQFNEVMVEFVAHSLGQLPNPPRKVWAVGERIHTLLGDAGLTPAALLPVPTSVNGITPLTGQILIDVHAARERGDVVEVYVFHNQPKSEASYEPVSTRLLPLDRIWRGKTTAVPWPTANPPQILDGTTTTLEALIRDYFFVLLFQACAESLASENASRLAAMQRAEKNIDTILEELNASYSRIRQESIDEELFDVISGFEALSGAGSHDGS